MNVIDEADNDEIIELNVGGKIMATKRTTLCQVEGSLLASMFSGRWEDNMTRDKDGRVFLDFNPTHFAYILDYLRAKRISIYDNIIPLQEIASNEAKCFYNLVKYLGLDDELSVPKALETDSFSLHSEGITLDENGAVAVISARFTSFTDTSTDTSSTLKHAFGTNTYKRGKYRFKIQLGYMQERELSMPQHHLVGIINDNVLGEDNSLNTVEFCYGWLFTKHNIYTYENGSSIRKLGFAFKEVNMFELMLDCDAAMIYLNLLNGLQSRVNLPKFSTYRLHVAMPMENSQARVRILKWYTEN